MITELWNTVIYEPLFNGLIYIYNNWTDQNFWWAVVYFTVIIRICLIPLSLFDAHKHRKNQEIQEDIIELTKGYRNDPILQKQEIRELLKKKRVNPWAKAVILGIQVIVFFELYDIFVRGLSNEKIIQILYPFIDFPGVINTAFYGFDLSIRHDVFWSAIVAIVTFLGIYVGYRKRKNLTMGDLAFLVLFPIAIFFFLFILPMVKALFILTTMLFSVIFNYFAKFIFPVKKKAVQTEPGKENT